MSKKISVLLLFMFLFPGHFAVYGTPVIHLGNVSGTRGEDVQLPVNLTTDTDCAALLLRLEYDAECLIPEAVTQGSLLSASHSMDYYSPEEGRVNIIVYSYQQYEPFTAQEGTAAVIDFSIKTDAPPGLTEIYLTSAGAPGLPVSELVDDQGSVLIPLVSSGSINIQSGTMASTWTLY